MRFIQVGASIFLSAALTFSISACAPAIKKDAWKVPPGNVESLILCEKTGSWENCTQTARDMCSDEYTVMEKRETDRRKEMKIHCRPK